MPSAVFLRPQASGGGAAETLEHTTASLADDAAEDFTLAVVNPCHLLSLELSHAAWFRAYPSAEARTVDASRTVDADPTVDVLLEVTSAGVLVLALDPAPYVEAATLYCRLTNLSGGAAAVNAALGFVGA